MSGHRIELGREAAEHWARQVETLEDLAVFVREHGPRSAQPLPVLNWRIGMFRGIGADLMAPYDPDPLGILHAYARVLGTHVVESVAADRRRFTLRGQIGCPEGTAREPGTSIIIQATVWRDIDGETPASDRYAPVDHPGVPVPADLRSWSAPYPGYAPVDITPPELLPAGLSASVAEGWAQPYISPQDVPDWPARRAAALIPYELDEQGWPLNPIGRTGRAGRNLGAWGENPAADPIVIAGFGTDRHVLLIRRRDRGQWAIPGGMVDPGETAPDALMRELREETGVDLALQQPVILARTYVEDWRATDHAWVCSTVALYELPAAAVVCAGDDADDAAWWPLPDLDTLTTALASVGGLYQAHRPLLVSALEQLTRTDSVGTDTAATADCPCGCTASFCRCADAEDCACTPQCPVCDADQDQAFPAGGAL